MRRSILARVKFLSRLLIALNLLPSIATLACVEQTQSAAERDKPGTDLPESAAAILAEIGNCLVVGGKPARQPHHLNVRPASRSSRRLDWNRLR